MEALNFDELFEIKWALQDAILATNERIEVYNRCAQVEDCDPNEKRDWIESAEQQSKRLLEIQSTLQKIKRMIDQVEVK